MVVGARNMALDVEMPPSSVVWVPRPDEMRSVAASRPASVKTRMTVGPVARRVSVSECEMRRPNVYANVRRAFMMSIDTRLKSGKRISQAFAEFDERSREWGRRWEREFVNHSVLEVRVQHFHPPVEPPATQGRRRRSALPREVQDSNLPRRLRYFGA